MFAESKHSRGFCDETADELGFLRDDGDSGVRGCIVPGVGCGVGCYLSDFWGGEEVS